MVVLMIMKLLNKKNKLAVAILAMYLSMIIQGTILFRPIGQINEIVSKPFPIVGGARYMILYAIANALVFIPLGTLLPFVWKQGKER